MLCRVVLLICLFISYNLSLAAQPKFDFDFSFNKYNLYNGERLTMLPTINYSNSPKGASFVKINYYLDDNLIGTATKAPFKLDYLLKNYPQGTHTLKVAVYATGTNLPVYGAFNFEYPITILGTLDGNSKTTANVIFKKIWLEHNVRQNGEIGMKVHISFDIYGMKGQKCNAIAYFDYPKGTGIKDLNGLYRTTAGTVCASTTFTPIYPESTFSDLSIFIPNSELHLLSGKKTYYTRVFIQAPNGGFLSNSDFVSFEGIGDSNSITNNENLAILTWLGSTTETTQKNYNLKISVKSSSKIEDVAIYINDEVHRGLNAVINDGYTSKIEKTLSLGEGNNNIKVVVKNSAGTSTIEKNIVLKSNYVQPANDKRIALIIGNSNYKDGNKLANPVNDATDIANKLEKLGFDVIKVLDQTKQGMETVMMQFGRKAANYDVALFYYAGHGVRYEGVNYLVPVNADLPDETSIKYNCTNANIVLDYMEKAKCKMKIVILDACRNNPFERSWHRGLDGGGLSFMSAPAGTFIAFSTAPGDVAADGIAGQRNSPYTSALLEMLDKPNVSLTDFFQEVLEKVARKTNNKQTPWTSNSFIGKFYFNKK